MESFCSECGETILFGGRKQGMYRYCSPKCQRRGTGQGIEHSTSSRRVVLFAGLPLVVCFIALFQLGVTLSVAIVLFDVVIWFVADGIATRRSGVAVPSVAKALAFATIFSPGVAIGHGIALFPAVPAMILQPQTIGLNGIPLVALSAIAYIPFSILIRRRLRRQSTAACM
jgi:hypothetical protein